MKTTALFILFILNINTISGQCLNQVLHTSGTMPVNGIQVTVNSAGIVDVNSAYCINTNPYFVGYNYITGSGNGGYTFNFSPSVNSLTLNFSGISNTPPNQEILSISINGQHYAVPSAGTSNGCDALAMLTSNGDITGCNSCAVSGWNGSTIQGPVYSLTILDSAISGIGNGALFSLFLCDGVETNLEENEINNHYRLYPNPFGSVTELHTERNMQAASLHIYNLYGQEVKVVNDITGNSIIIYRYNLPNGIYFLHITDNGKTITGERMTIMD